MVNDTARIDSTSTFSDSWGEVIIANRKQDLGSPDILKTDPNKEALSGEPEWTYDETDPEFLNGWRVK